MIGLRTLLELVEKAGDEFKYVRCLSCDVAEVRLIAGKNIELNKLADKQLVGLSPSPETGLLMLNNEGRTGRGLLAHIIPNGVLEVHRGKWLGGIPPWKGVSHAEKVERRGDLLWALVGLQREDQVVHKLYCRYGGQWMDDYRSEHSDWWRDALATKECLHRFEMWGRTGFDENTKAIDMCQYCGEERERPAKPDERMSMEEFMSAKIHEVCHAFEEHMGGGDILALEVQGFEAIERAEEFANKYPDDIHVVGVDDAVFSSSCLFLVNHRTDKEFMGTSVYYIPQNGGTGAEFFLYSGHRKALLNALKLIEKQAAAYPSHLFDD